ncbi:prephenate dehydratase [Streptoalloteichus tenebrarius]|uniref:Prephenate dehydratase n=1 Tax=Streptoalloteichus tenebrarius (strain ATCC 17920 / DSM 40477 / JCM 4838 / CBS 697.72 / NBRC 16177 / NCIMB 11028 / NRRL B-12390 / A12253. 1 / ISP 5477) TaxID=1933 RepID=A0ABT1I4G6_STRSD|nr:prephenate dehydratase [Streptoalloteichus tenebrarius]MCP2262644.1 prephenate dehydratase [Streptoalloteichus tenebrarius]BFF01827.1 prephenate dehydratase [Streptoalloteichus tenebrarius]
MPRIAYFGPEGTFTEQATRAFLGDPPSDTRPAPPDSALRPVETIAAALDAVRAGDAEAACVPVENSVEGSVAATLDALVAGDPLVAVAETVLPIRFTVLVRPGATPADIRTVATHPHAAAQVRGWLAEHLPSAAVLPSSSTAAAAVGVLAGEFDAAVTAPAAAERYPLAVLAADVADVRDAVTRFLLVRRPGPLPARTGADRTSVAAVTADRIGALSEVLTVLAGHGINMTRIESRPTRNRLGEYRFFVDFEGHVADERVGDAMAALRRRCTEVRFLGSFPRADQAPNTVVPTTSDEDFLAARRWLTSVREGREA